MATYLVCKTFSSTETISWEDVTYTLGTDAFNDIVTAELVASQDSPDLENEIIVFAGNYTSSLNNFQNYEGITLNVTGVKYHGDDANKATVTLKTFKNSGIATFANAAFNATSVINNAGKTITLNGATFTAAEGVANAGTFKVTNNSTVNAEFTGAGTVSLSGRILNSSMTGSQAFVTATNTAFYGDTTLGGEGSTLNVKAGTWLMIADTGILNLDAVTGSGYLLVQKATDDNLATLKNSTINGTVYFAKDSKLVGANTITAFTTKSNATGVSLEDGASLTAGSVTIQSGSDFTVVASSTLKAEAVSGSGTLNLIGTLDTAEGKTLTNSGNIIVSTGTVAGDVKLASTGKIVFGTLDKAANASLTGSIIDADEDTAGKTFQVLNGNVIFEKDSNVDLSFSTGAGKWFMVGFTDASIDPADVAATLTVKGTVVAHDGTWIGAASAYDESFFDKKYALVVDGGSFTNTRNAFTVRASGEVVVTNGGTFTVTCDSPIRGNITVKEGSQATLARSAFYGEFDGEKGVTSTLTVNNSALTIGSSPITIGHSKLYTEKDEDVKDGLKQVGENKDDERKGAMILDKAAVTGGAFDVGRTGSVSASNGTTIDITGTINNAGAISIVADCTTLKTTLKADAIANAATGSITIDATGYTGGIVKVIDLSQNKKLDKVTVDAGDTGAKVAYGKDGDVVIHDIDVDKVYVSADWTTGYETGAAVETSEGTAYYGINAFGSMIDAMDTKAATIQLESSISEKLTDDYEFIIDKDTQIVAADTATAGNKYVVSFYNDKTSYDIVLGSIGSKELTIASNVEFGITDRNIWTGYYGDKNLTVKVDGTLYGGYQIWNGSTTNVSATGKLVSAGEAFVIRRGKTITLTGNAAAGATVAERTAQIEANYFSLLSGTIDAHNTYIYGGQIGIGNYPNYSYEGPVNLLLDNTIWQSTGFLNATTTKSGTTAHGSVLIDLANGSTISARNEDGLGSVFDANTVVNVKSGSLFSLQTVTNSGEVTIDGGTFSATSLTNNGSFTVSGVSTLDIATLTGKAIEVAAGSTIKDSTVGGEVALNRGETKFVGTNSINTLSLVDYFSSETATITVAKGDSLTTGRMSFGYNLAVGVTGGIVNALDSELVLTDDDVSFAATQGISFVGWGSNSITVKDAYIKLYGQATTPTKSAKGNYNLSFTNSVADIQTLKIFNRADLGNVNVTFDASKLNNTSHLTNESPKSTMTFKNGSVAIATGSFKNGGDFQVLSGSKFTANAISTNKAPYGIGENAGNYGSITVDGGGSEMALNIQDYFYSGSIIEGQPATITVTKGGKFSFTGKPLVNAGAITIDTASLLVGTELINTETGTITIDAKNLAPESYVKVIDLKQASALTGVKVLGDAHAVYGADGDVVVTNITANKLYVNDAWAGKEFGDKINIGTTEAPVYVYYGINAFDTLAGASGAAAPSTDAVTINIAGNLDGKANFNFGQNVVISGTAAINWKAGWLFVGRDENGLPVSDDGATVTFKDATITSINPSTGFSSTGFHVSGATGTGSKTNNGILNIEDSTMTCDYLLDRNLVNISNSTATFVNLYVHGRNASESRSGKDETATLNISDDSTVTLTAINGMPLGVESYGVINVTDSTFAITANSAWTIAEKGVVNLNGNATFTAADAVINNGAINAYADSTITTTGLFTNDNEVVLVGTTLTTNGIVNNASFKATDSVIDGGGKAGSPHITNGLGGTMELTNSIITTGAFIINSYGTSISLDKSTLDARIINSKEITAVDSTIISTDLRNEGGKFVVSGDSSLNVKLTNGTIDLENATLTATTVTGDGNLSIAAKYVKKAAVPAQGVEGEEGYVPGQDAELGDNVVTFNGANTVNAITNAGTLKIQTIPAVEAVPAQGEEGEEGYVPAQDEIPAVAGALTAGAITNTAGTITIDATSTLTATSIAGGTIELTNFADNATRPVITVNGASAEDFTATVQWKYGVDPETGLEKTYTLDGATTYTLDKKFLVQKTYSEGKTTISVVDVAGGQSTLLVDAKWAGVADGTPVEGYDGNDYVIGFNAFGDFKSALAVAQTNKGATIDFGTASYVWAQALNNDAYKADITTAGEYTLTNGDGFLLNYEVEIDTAEQTTFTIDDAFITLTKLTARKNTDITISDSRVDFNWFEGGSAYLSAYKGSTLTISNSMVGFDPYDNKDKAETPEGLSPAGTGSSAYWHWGPRVVVYGETEITDSTMYIYVGQADNTGFDVLGNSDTTVSGSYISLARLNVGDHYAKKYLADGDDETNLNASLEISNSTLVNTQYRGDDNGKPLNGIVVGSASNAGVKGALTVTDESLVDFTVLTYGGDAREVGLQVNNSGSTVTVSEDSTMILPKITNAGSITVDSGSTLTATGLISNSGSIEVKAGSTLSTTSTANPALNNQGTLTVNGSTVEAARAVNTGTMTIENGAKFYASILLENTTSGTITFNGATLAKKADSTDATSFSNWAGITQFNNGSTVNANIAVHNGQVVVDASTVNGNVNVIAGSFTVGGASTLNVGALTGTINVLDGAALTADIIGAEDADSAVVFDGKTTGITLAEGAVINTVAENYGKVSAAADLQVKTLFNGASDGSVKGTITAATLTADSIVNNNGAAHKGGSTIELTGDLVAAGDILNGAAPIVPGTDEPADKAFITAANITAGSIKNYGTVGSQAEGKELATITLNASTGTLTNGLYGNVFATTLNAASIENEGGIVVENINITSTDGVIENKAGGKIAQDNVPMTIAAKEIKNAGEISTHGGAITATAITNNAYNADTNDGLIWTDSITADGTVTNYGKIDVDGALTANRVVNSAGEFTVNGESKIVAVSGVANSGNVVVSGGKVTFNGDVTAKNLNAQNASATININNATTVSVAEKVYYYGTIVATNSVLDGIEFSDGGSGTGTLKVVKSSIKGIKLNHGTMQLDKMSLADVTIDGAFDVVGDSDFSGVNEVEGLTVSEGATLTISALATITSLTQPSLTVTAGDLVNHGTITIDAYGLEWGSTLKQLKVVSVTGEGKKAFSDGTITVKNAEDTMAIVQDDGIYLYYVKSSGETKTLFVNAAWNYAPGYEWDYDADHHLVFGMNAFQDADDIVFYANTDALVFVGGNTTPYADLDWSKDDVSVTIDGGLEAKFSDIKLGSATLTGDIRADDLTFTGDTTVSGKIFANKLTVDETLAIDWTNPVDVNTLDGDGSITIGLDNLQNVLSDTAVITADEGADFASIVTNYEANKDIFAINEAGTTLSLSAKAIGKVSKGVTEDPNAGVYNSISKAVSNENTKLILIVDGDFGNASLKGKRTQVLTSGTVGNYYFAGGCNVATEPLNPESPYAFLYGDYKEFNGSTNVTIENGQFSNAVVIGADLVQLATSESSVTFFHIGDSNLTINGGHFEAAKNSSTGGYGERAIAGGMYYNIASGKTGEARLFGNVNLTITGGEFIGYNVYGGNFVNGTKVLCNRTNIKGNITLTLDATANELNFTANEGGFGGIVQAGSFGQSNVIGNSEVILKGAKGITFEYLVGGSTSDDHILKNGKWTCESFVTGTRTLTFSGFTGDLDFSKVSDFTTVAFEGTNEVNFAGEFHRYFNDDVTNWVFEEGASLGGTVNFDFTGDSVDVLGSLELYKSNVTGFDIANVTYDTTKLAFEETATSYLFTTIA